MKEALWMVFDKDTFILTITPIIHAAWIGEYRCCDDLNQCVFSKFGFNVLPCDTPCEQCFGKTSDECFSCNDGWVLHGSSCLLECPIGFFNYPGGKTCKKCGEGCGRCNAERIDDSDNRVDCLECYEPYFLTHKFYSKQAYCTLECKWGEYGN